MVAGGGGKISGRRFGGGGKNVARDYWGGARFECERFSEFDRPPAINNDHSLSMMWNMKRGMDKRLPLREPYLYVLSGTEALICFILHYN